MVADRAMIGVRPGFMLAVSLTLTQNIIRNPIPCLCSFQPLALNLDSDPDPIPNLLTLTLALIGTLIARLLSLG